MLSKKRGLYSDQSDLHLEAGWGRGEQHALGLKVCPEDPPPTDTRIKSGFSEAGGGGNHEGGLRQHPPQQAQCTDAVTKI